MTEVLQADVRARMDDVRSIVARAARRAGREDNVTIVAVSKGTMADRIPTDLGWVVGESRTKELLAKQEALSGADLTWHFVGTLQRKKARDVVGRVALIHSVDSVALAEEIARRAGCDTPQSILLQVNTSDEAAKHGVALTDADAAARTIASLPGVRLDGFMTMAPAGDPSAARTCFAALRDVRDRLVAELPTARELSMGMSGDLEVAVEEGATLVRVGTGIFGPRPP